VQILKYIHYTISLQIINQACKILANVGYLGMHWNAESEKGINICKLHLRIHIASHYRKVPLSVVNVTEDGRVRVRNPPVKVLDLHSGTA